MGDVNVHVQRFDPSLSSVSNYSESEGQARSHLVVNALLSFLTFSRRIRDTWRGSVRLCIMLVTLPRSHRHTSGLSGERDRSGSLILGGSEH